MLILSHGELCLLRRPKRTLITQHGMVLVEVLPKVHKPLECNSVAVVVRVRPSIGGPNGQKYVLAVKLPVCGVRCKGGVWICVCVFATVCCSVGNTLWLVWWMIWGVICVRSVRNVICGHEPV